MKNIFRRLFPLRFVQLKAIRRLVLNRDSYLYESGLMHSYLVSKPETRLGEPLPWMNFNVIHLLDSRLDSSMSLFEFGSGYSTLYYASRVARVVAVEHNLEWFEQLRDTCPGNAEPLFRPEKSTYIGAIREFDTKFEVVIVDGVHRNECINSAIERLTSDGVIILDDSDRGTFSSGRSQLMDLGFRSIVLEGLKPTSGFVARTEIFYRDGNCLGL